ncbi:uncharacterized protein J7T54_000510 [Emericellopsis cladophorae]|uniref:Gylcosyl hydrolase 115 C-terminal domain-containing protein n=1 Tax=Emericellopsis cladophorae TaxID=2686198 RepID=A0A9P9XW00_9HYPO|nr:uncharacterized protein J7T54_000510 [Emericellopsis cladophorae]KAI6778854.1 hypothetical protein J7T54_000510 [Emericellopsis cladophorae]
MGVSPWYWWADVPVKTKSDIWVRKGPKVQGSPSVKYRGFFINDESPALTGWANGKFTKSEYGSSFTGEFYKLVFELCLRLKGNYIWPAMWSSMFYVDDIENGHIADDLVFSSVPAITIPWRELKRSKIVGKYYQAGMKTPDNVILLWTDDNSGDIQPLPLANETDRIGGAVEAGKTVVDLYNKHAFNAWYAQQGRTSTNTMANDVQALFAQDQVIEEKYHSLNGGKWDHFVNQVHIGYTYWQDPPAKAMPDLIYLDESNTTDDEIMGVSVQGSTASAPGAPLPALLPVEPYMPPTEKRYVDIFTRNNGTFAYHISSNVSYVFVTNAEGRLEAPGSSSDSRSGISVDCQEAPPGISWVALRVKRTDVCKGPAVVALLPVNKNSVPDEFEGYVESGGVVSWEAEHYSSAEEKNGLSYITIPDYGRTLSGLKLWPVTHPGRTPEDTPKLTYSFYSFTDQTEAQLVVYLGGSLNHDPSLPLKYAHALEGGSPVEVQPIPDEAMGSLPHGWNEATVAGGWTSYSTLKVPAGAHKLSLWLLEPGVVVQKVVMDVGGLKRSALGPPKSQKA